MNLAGTDNSMSPLNSAAKAQLLTARKVAFFLLTIFCVAIPGFAAVKAGLIGLSWIAIVVFSQIRLQAVFWFVSILLSLVLSGEIALLRGVAVSDFSNHLSRLLLFFLVLGIGASIARSGLLNSAATDWLMLAVAMISAALKVAILAVVLSGIASFEAVQSSLGFESVTDDIGFGLQRLQFPSDIILIFLLSCYSGRRKLVDLLFLLCATVSVMLSFSRYLFAAYIVCLIIRFLRLRRLDLISGSAVVIGVLLAATFSVSLAGRFAGEGTKVSDNIRTEQSRYLVTSISEHPLLGSGIGSSVNGYKRSETMPFSYEVEWYAMTMQLGLVGLAWFLFNLTAPIVSSVQTMKNRLISFGVLIVWIAGGFTNPFLISLGSAFGLSILMVTMAREARPRSLPEAKLRSSHL